ncbi:hypothetical protein JL720_11981 [Aureococcus anophagefferens]|nr:hypothetical protein JL720_11981 [Aureococcus anophagefferens]
MATSWFVAVPRKQTGRYRAAHDDGGAGPRAPGSQCPDDASCVQVAASIDLSELFNPSALTRLLRQLNDQIDGQRDQIVFLEEQSIANAAFREMWAQDRAEFRAALAVATEENNKKINEAIGAAAASVSDLRKTYNEERAFRRICHFAAHRTEIMQREKWETWARACREMRLWDKRRAVLIRMGNMNEKRHQTFGMTRWREQTARARDAATMHNGANALIDALYVKRAVRRSFRHWVECVLLEQISDAFGGVEIVTSAHHEQVLSVAEAAAKPLRRPRGGGGGGGQLFGEAFKQAHLGTMQVVKVMSSEQDMARQRDREALEGECENIRKALATVSAAAEEKRALEAKKALDRGNERLDKQLATTRRQIDGKITERITEALAQVEANAAGHAERAEARAKAADQRVAAKLQAADDRAMAAAHDVEALVHGCEAQSAKQMSRAQTLVSEAKRNLAVEQQIRGVYEDAAPSSPGSVPQNVHHHHHHPAQKHFHKAPSVQWYDSETRAGAARRRHVDGADAAAAGAGAVAEAAPVRMRARRRGMMEGLETGRVKGSVWDTVETNHKMVIARLDDLRDTTDMLREKSAATLGGPPPRPDPRAVAVDVVGPYEELVFQKKRVVKPLGEFADARRRQRARVHVAAVANLEEIARDAAEAALSIFDQVIADAPTLLGRSKALPSCVACNRPLPTKARRPAPPKRDERPAPEPPAGVEKLLASKGPDVPRPLTAPPGSKREEERKPVMSASERALKILHAHLPQTQTYGAAEVDNNSTNDQSSYSRNSGPQYYDDAVRTYDHRVGDNTAAFLEQRALHDAEQARRAQRPQSAPRSGRALP